MRNLPRPEPITAVKMRPSSPPQHTDSEMPCLLFHPNSGRVLHYDDAMIPVTCVRQERDCGGLELNQAAAFQRHLAIVVALSRTEYSWARDMSPCSPVRARIFYVLDAALIAAPVICQTRHAEAPKLKVCRGRSRARVHCTTRCVHVILATRSWKYFASLGYYNVVRILVNYRFYMRKCRRTRVE